MAGWPLVTGDSGAAIGLGRNFGISPSPAAASLGPPRGWRAIVSGSCSLATQRQVRRFIEAGGSALRLDATRIAAGEDLLPDVLAWAGPRLAAGAVLVYTTADEETLREVQGQHGAQAAGAAVEQLLAAVAAGLVEMGVGQLIVAGGETSGACMQRLGIRQLQIGAPISSGVPWCRAVDASQGSLHLALKSGNFGDDDFFLRAFTMLA